MELKTPTKKGIKTPRYRPPLPMLNDSGSGLCVDEYDWPLFTGYYNGNSVIVDDSQAMTLLTNKGFFGKGSLSKGCPNLSKRKIPNSVVYESQWKRRKMWIESLNNLLESKKKCNEALNEGDVDEIENKKSDVAEKLEVESESNGIIENKTEQESSNPSEGGNENSQNKSNDTSKENSVDTENEKSNEVEKKDIDNEEKSLVGNDLSRTEEESSTKNGNEGSENDSNETSKDNVVDTEDKKRDDVEKMEVDNEKNNTLSDSSKEEIPPNTSGCDEIKNNSYEASQENIVDINNKINDSEKKETGSTENNLCNPDEEPSKTSTNEGNGDGSASTDAVVETTQKTNETESQKELSESEKNENNLKDNERIEVNDVAIAESTSSNVINIESKCVRKINPSSNPEKSTLNINEVLVIPDIDGELEQYFHNLKPHIEEEKVKTAIEVLYLSLEEAFFLSYCCNCLQIFDLTSNILQIKDMWVLFQESQSDFIEKYVAYHYFRAKGWVVKSGTKFGGDFLLYKKGPLYFHASYIVIVEVIKNNENSRSKITWQKIVGMNRMAESANKEILICHVLWPDVEKGKFNDPGILKEFGVSETLLRRWQATHEKTP